MITTEASPKVTHNEIIKEATPTLAGTIARTLADPDSAVADLHLFTFNQVRQTEQWRSSLLARLAGPVRERQFINKASVKVVAYLKRRGSAIRPQVVTVLCARLTGHASVGK